MLNKQQIIDDAWDAFWVKLREDENTSYNPEFTIEHLVELGAEALVKKE